MPLGRFLISVSLLSVSGCATTSHVGRQSQSPNAVRTSPTPSAEDLARSEHERLFALFQKSDEANLKLSPLVALGRGDMRFADQFGDYITDEGHAARRKIIEENLAALSGIDRSKLSQRDAVAFDVFKFNSDEQLRSFGDDLLPL